MKNSLIFICLILLFGCKQLISSGNAKSEKLLGLGFDYEKKEIILTLVSNGCTNKADFVLLQKDNGLLVIRKRIDECKAIPEAVQFRWSFAEAGIETNRPFKVYNSFSGDIFNANILNHEK